MWKGKCTVDWPTSVMALTAAMLGSSAFTAFISHLFGRKKLTAEVAKTTVENALALETIAVERYQTAAEALSAAEKLLKYANSQLVEQALYIKKLQDLLDEAGITYPKDHTRVG